VNRRPDYLDVRLKLDAIFKHYAAQSECYRRATIVQRLQREDCFYHLTMELLSKIIGPVEVIQ